MSVDDHEMAKITGSPVLDTQGGRLYVPVGSWEEVAYRIPTYECCTFQGSVVALDAKTGQQIWKAYTIPERPRPVRKLRAGGQNRTEGRWQHAAYDRRTAPHGASSREAHPQVRLGSAPPIGQPWLRHYCPG